MKINLDYEEGIKLIDEMINAMPKTLQCEEKAVLKKIGVVVKQNVVRILRHSDVDTRAKQILPSNYDGSRPYIHLKDDVEIKVKKDKMGNNYVSIRGRKMTGYKWGFISDGHIARDGSTFIQGTNFIQMAVQSSEGEVENLINEMIKKVVD